MSKSYLTKSLGYKFKPPGYRTGFAPKATYKGGMNGPYQAPTSSAWGGNLGAGSVGTIQPTGQVTGGALGGSSGTPAQPSAPVQPITSPSTTDPRDPTYWTNVGALNFAYNNAVAGLGTRDVAASTKLANSLAEYGRQEPIDTQHQRENYNDQGLFYSGHLGQAYGNLVADYARRRTASRDEFATEHSNYLGQLDFLKGQLGIQTAQELNAATERQIGADTNSANNNSLASLASAIAGSSAPIAKPTVTGQSQQATSGAPPYRTVPYTNSQGIKGVLHIYPGGRKVFVRK